ncbi:hypothetical protein BDW02DRAFT_568559 [Decorospora gaudefroyi]|uniref:Uncharacterized protein n=1 Tax=Decorospora gaudefroyi TaxID=184978 RepID=A0A6A5KF80_9PLEO|nr:hypothetical protein BDW02DRAFT_568559 [Decorospora gaudefroyi]
MAASRILARKAVTSLPTPARYHLFNCNNLQPKLHRASCIQPNSTQPSSTEPNVNVNRMSAAEPLIAWIAAHPYQTFFHVVNGVVLLTPAAATVPFFSALGMTAGGPVAGGALATITSYFSFVPAGGLVATAQSAAMGGYGASFAAGAAQAGAVASSAFAHLLGRQG